MANIATTAPSLHQQYWRPYFFSRAQFPLLNVSFNILRCNFAQQMLTSTSRHAILNFIIPILVNFIEVKYQGKPTSPFETHPLTTTLAITALLAYCLAYGAEQTFSSSPYAYVLCWSMTFSGSIALASLASILLPHSMQFVVYTFYILLSMGELNGVVHKLCHWIYHIIMNKFFNVYLTQQFYAGARTRPILPRSVMDAGDVLQI